MKTFIKFLFLAVFLVILAYTAFTQIGKASSLDDIKNATTTFNIYQGSVYVGRCTAEFISPDVVITAAHCATDGDNFTVGIPIKEFIAIPIVAEKSFDMMVLYVKDYHSPYYVDIFAPQPKKEFSEVTTVCFFGDVSNEYHVINGTITGVGETTLTTEGKNPFTIKAIGVSFDIQEGCSGGGLYRQTSDGDYRLISIASGHNLESKTSIYSYPDNLFNILAMAQDKL